MLLNRMDRIVTEDVDKQEEEVTIKKALGKCGYPLWSFEQVKKKMQSKKQKAPSKNKDSLQNSRGMVVLPYLQGLTERPSRVFKKYDIATAMKPHSSLRKFLVHPKDQIDPLEKMDCIYEIPCKICAYTYIGETGQKFTSHIKEHKKEADKLESKNKNFTRQTRKQSVGEQSKSAITDHTLQNKHVINWDDAKVLQMECDASAGYICKSIWIRKRGTNVMNRDEGSTF